MKSDEQPGVLRFLTRDIVVFPDPFPLTPGNEASRYGIGPLRRGEPFIIIEVPEGSNVVRAFTRLGRVMMSDVVIGRYRSRGDV